MMSLSKDQQILHLLNRASFGPVPGDVERVRQMGLDAFLEEQLHPEKIDDSAVEERLAKLPTLSMSSSELIDNFPPPRQAGKKGQDNNRRRQREMAGEAPADVQMNSMEAASPEDRQTMREQERLESIDGPRRIIVELSREELWRAVYSRRQLQEVMVQFWMNHFNIYARKGADKWLLTSFERDTIRPRAIGNFEDLLVATAKSPAMLFYLDNWMSAAPQLEQAESAEHGNGASHPANEFSRNVGPRFEQVALAGGEPQRPIWNRQFGRFPRARRMQVRKAKKQRGLNENYGRELMELHTLGVNGGYTQQDVVEVARCLTGWTIQRPRQDAEFYFNPNMHDYGPKVVLGQKIRTGGGMEDGLAVLHLLAHHPSTARFISLEMSRRFVSDNPPDSVVDRAANTFQESGGDIRQVLQTLFTSPEFYSPTTYRAKVKSPLEFMASSLRAVGGETDAGLPLIAALAKMGEPLFQYEAPSGYADQANTWINSSSLLWRMNFAMLLAANRLPGTKVDLSSWTSTGASGNAQAVMRQVSERLLGGPPSPGTAKAILDKGRSGAHIEQAVFSPDEDRSGIATIAGLLLSSPDFQRR